MEINLFSEVTSRLRAGDTSPHLLVGEVDVAKVNLPELPSIDIIPKFDIYIVN